VTLQKKQKEQLLSRELKKGEPVARRWLLKTLVGNGERGHADCLGAHHPRRAQPDKAADKSDKKPQVRLLPVLARLLSRSLACLLLSFE